MFEYNTQNKTKRYLSPTIRYHGDTHELILPAAGNSTHGDASASQETLEMALREFEGAVVMVSHDRPWFPARTDSKTRQFTWPFVGCGPGGGYHSSRSVPCFFDKP